MRTYVWYAAYGSNLSRTRFEHYLRGGTPPGGRRRYAGARDHTAATHDRPATLPWPLRFAGRSRTWGGGMAFVDTAAHGRTLARLYRITADQLVDVHAQENAGDTDVCDVRTMEPGDRIAAGRGNYPDIVCCRRLDGEPMVTFAATQVTTPAPPSPPYLRTIAVGFAEAHGLDRAAIVSYLRATPVVAAAYSRRALDDIVADADQDHLIAASTGTTDAATVDVMVAPPTHSSPS